MKNQKRSLFVILNEELVDEPALERAISDLRKEGFDLRVRLASNASEFYRLTKHAVDEAVDVVVVSGGDGTINEVLHVLSDSGSMSQCAVGILPAGTANDFATACQIPISDAGAALRTAAEAPIATIDIGRVNDRLFVNATSGGYGAEVTATAPPELKNTLGGFAYLVNGLLHVPEIRSRRAHVRAPKFQWEGDMIGFSVANGRQAGGGFQIAPSATVDDGLLDLVVFPEVQKGGWSGLLTDLLSKAEEEELEYLVSRRAPWFEIEVEEAIHFNIDGEPLEATSLHFDILEKKARFCLPLSDLWTP